MTLIIIIIGLALIFLGKKTIWLGVFAGVFLISSTLLGYILFDLPEETIWIISSVMGAISLVLYFAIEKAIVFFMGAIIGGFGLNIFVTSSQMIGLDSTVSKAIVFLVGGIIGIVLLKVFYEWLAAVFTTLIGAYLISSLIQQQPLFKLTAIVILTVIGLIVQNKIKVSHKAEDFTTASPQVLH